MQTSSLDYQYSNNTIILRIIILQCLAVLRCCDLFVSGRLNIN